jgi:hypothetical protein
MSEITRAEKLCEWVIAYDYYDGPLAGIGLRSKSRTFLFFKAVAWDEEHWKRVFSVTDLQSEVALGLLAALEKFEPRKEPFWFPSGMTHQTEVSSAWEAVRTAALDSKKWALVESHNLLDAAEELPLSADEGLAVVSVIRGNSLKDISGDMLLSKFASDLQAKV